MHIEPDQRPKKYNDGKIRKVTHHNKVYYWDCIEKDDNEVVTIYDAAKVPFYKYTGDPHDKTPAGVRKILREVCP